MSTPLLRNRTPDIKTRMASDGPRNPSSEPGELEPGKASSVAQHVARVMAREVVPSLLSVSVMLCLIFGGCCSNVCISARERSLFGARGKYARGLSVRLVGCHQLDP